VRILWAARWEHDKNPEDFFEALKRLKEKQIEFRMSVIGPQFREVPEVFAWAEQFFAGHIDRWGYQSSRDDYESALAEADIIVSTANHEFFGLSVAEAIAAGAFPLLPKRLSYPEILSSIEIAGEDEFFYDGTVGGLAKRLADLSKAIADGNLWAGDNTRGTHGMKRFYWQNLTPILDAALQKAKA
jgi:glycosyltransferase involved in cell wall biosynthesis